MQGIDLRSRRTWCALAAIAAVGGSAAAVFAWANGWIGGRETSNQLVQDLPQPFPPGYRRAHGKGACFVGTFRPAAAAAQLSSARVFHQASVAVAGRFSIGAGNPHAADGSTNTVSMALQLVTDDTQQWRMAMNNQPFFATRDPSGFLAMRRAAAPDPATGKPDPARLAAFLKDYPEAEKFMQWAAQAPAPGNFAGATFYSINAFVLVAPDGLRQAVRWTMRPHAPFVAMPAAQRKAAGHDFLFDDLQRTLSAGSLSWDLVLQLAQPGDAVDNPSQPWPADRSQVLAGTLEVTGVVDQSDGPCRDINFDPTIVPAGIEVSGDPVLSARSGAYSHSFNRRIREIGYGKSSDAVGKPETK